MLGRWRHCSCRLLEESQHREENEHRRNGRLEGKKVTEMVAR